MASESTARIVAAIAAVPRGRVTSYGRVAAAAGMPGGARQVVRVLHTSSGKGLPWFRILRADGSIALPRGGGFELQKALLEAEGVRVGPGGKVDLSRFGWEGSGGPELSPSGKTSGRRRA